MKINRLASATKILLDIMFYGGILTCVTLPWWMQWLGTYYPSFQEFYRQMLFIYAGSGILAVAIIWQLRKIFKTVLKKDCFVDQNTRSLKTIGWLAFGLAAVMACRLFFIVTPATLIIVLVFLVGGLFSLVLSQVFQEAVNYKNENDLTI
jgi:hypothetical protein